MNQSNLIINHCTILRGEGDIINSSHWKHYCDQLVRELERFPANYQWRSPPIDMCSFENTHIYYSAWTLLLSTNLNHWFTTPMACIFTFTETELRMFLITDKVLKILNNININVGWFLTWFLDFTLLETIFGCTTNINIRSNSSHVSSTYILFTNNI